MAKRTLAEAWSQYYPRRVKRKRSEKEQVRIWEKYIAPEFGNRLVDKISLRDLEDFHAKFKKTPYMGNRVLVLLRSLFRYSIALRWTAHNPASGVRLYTEKRRRRHMQAHEAELVAATLIRLEPTSPMRCLFLWLVILTGARTGEIKKARWKDLRGTKLILDEHKTDETTGMPRAIELSNFAMEKLGVLAAPLEMRKPDDLIIPYKVPAAFWGRIKKLTGINDLRLHDLRHTFGVYAVERGYTLEQIGEALNHVNPNTTKIYTDLTSQSRQRIANDVSLALLADMKIGEPRILEKKLDCLS